MANRNLKEAKAAKNDEFYTQFQDIQSEINAYLDYDPDVFRGKQYCFRVMTLSGVILLVSLLLILTSLD